MALVRTDYTARSSEGSRGIDANSWAPAASYVLPANSLVVVAVNAVADHSASLRPSNLTLALTGATATVRVTTGNPVQWGYGVRIFTFETGSSGITSQFTVKCGTDIPNQYWIETASYTGYDTVNPIGGTAIGTDADGTGAASITLSAAPVAGDETLSYCSGVTRAGQCPVTAGTGFTNLSYLGSNGWGYLQSAARSGSTSASVPWADVGVPTSGVNTPLEVMLAALVIKAQAAAVTYPALTITGGKLRQVLASEYGTGIKPLVWNAGVLKLRTASEGVPVVMIGGKLVQLPTGGTLGI